MVDFRAKLAEELAKHVELPKEEIEGLIETPPAEFGDYAFPCFGLAKKLRKNPADIANELKAKIPLGKFFERVEVKGPYLNFFVNQNLLFKDTLAMVLKDKQFGSLKLKSKKALIEHTSTNPNASPHVGRARNALIGDSLARLLKFHGYKTEVHYLVNDVGKQIAMLVLACEKKKNPSFQDMLQLYVQINKELEAKPELEKKIFELLNKLEAGDKKTRALFKKVVKICVDGQKGLLLELGIKFNYFDFESVYLWNKRTDEILAKLEKTGKVFVDDEKRKALDLNGFDLPLKSPVLILTRADGTSLYVLRDIAYTIDKMHREKENNIVVLGEDHKSYFLQLSAALSILGEKAPKPVHYSFILLKEGKMSTRQGNVVLLEDFMKEAVEKAKKEIAKRENISKNELESTAKAIGYGAIKYSILKVSPEKNVTFDWDSALSFEGDSAPYIQYSYARICSIFRKCGGKINKKADLSVLTEKDAVAIKVLSEFPDVAEKALKELKPHLVANYAYRLAGAFNDFYRDCPVICEDACLMDARLLLIDCVKQVLKASLDIIGVEAIERM